MWTVPLLTTLIKSLNYPNITTLILLAQTNLPVEECPDTCWLETSDLELNPMYQRAVREWESEKSAVKHHIAAENCPENCHSFNPELNIDSSRWTVTASWQKAEALPALGRSFWFQWSLWKAEGCVFFTVDGKKTHSQRGEPVAQSKRITRTISKNLYYIYYLYYILCATIYYSTTS